MPHQITGFIVEGVRMPYRSALTRGLVAAACLASAGYAVADPPVGAAAATKLVSLKDVAIRPAHLSIRRGTTVRWRWLDESIQAQHNVTSLRRPGGLRFRSSPTKLTGVYTVRFSRPGRYYYECNIHPLSMQGVIVVR